MTGNWWIDTAVQIVGWWTLASVAALAYFAVSRVVAKREGARRGW